MYIMNGTISESREKPVKRQRKLLFQIGVILVPLFLIMLVLVAQTMYRSTINGYLKAQNSRMKDQLKLAIETGFYIFDELKEKAPGLRTGWKRRRRIYCFIMQK